MDLPRIVHRLTSVGWLLACLAAISPFACSPVPPLPSFVAFKCGAMDVPCGNGCMPAGVNTTCCATDGPTASTTSSYCVSGACYPTTGDRCELNGTPTQFCCGPFGAIGSNDCPAGTHHCGLATAGGAGCVPNTQVGCCDESAGQTCNAQVLAPTPAACPTNGGTDAIVCGYCPATAFCQYCPQGTCCNGDVCSASSTCSVGDACYVNGGGTAAGPGDGGGTSGGGGCAGKCSNGYCGACSATADCCTGAVCISTKVCSVNSVAAGCECSALGTFGVSGVCGDFADNGLAQITSCGEAGSASCNTQTSWCCPGLVAVQNGAACTCEDPTSPSYECPGQ